MWPVDCPDFSDLGKHLDGDCLRALGEITSHSFTIQFVTHAPQQPGCRSARGQPTGEMADAREGVMERTDKGGARERRCNGPPDFSQPI
jgi:hypothetical protein